MDRYYKVAGLTVKMDAFGWAESNSRLYEIEKVDSVDVEIYPEWSELKEKYPEMTDNICYYNASGIEFYHNLIDFGGMMLHSSAVALNGKAYLFSADPGTGKSTHTSLWRRVFGDENVRMLNDDKPALRYENGIWYAYGTPWSGKTPLNLNLRYPLGGIAFLERGEVNHIERYTDSDLVYRFLNQTSRPTQPERRAKLLSHISSIIQEVPVWKLQCNMDPEAAIVAYEAMSGEKAQIRRQ